VTGTLDRHRQLALMLGTRPGLPSRANLAAIGQKTPQWIGALVVNVCDLFLAKDTGLATPGEAPPAILITILILIPAP
jgi:hypothetical protein